MDGWVPRPADAPTPMRCDVPPCRLCPGLTDGWWLLARALPCCTACLRLFIGGPVQSWLVAGQVALLASCMALLLYAGPAVDLSIAEAPGRPRSVPLASRSGASACVIREQIALYEQCYAGKGKRGRSRCGAAWRPSRRHRSRPGARGAIVAWCYYCARPACSCSLEAEV